MLVNNIIADILLILYLQLTNKQLEPQFAVFNKLRFYFLQALSKVAKILVYFNLSSY